MARPPQIQCGHGLWIWPWVFRTRGRAELYWYVSWQSPLWPFGNALIAGVAVHHLLITIRPFWVEIDITPLSDRDGWFTYWVSVQRECREPGHTEHLYRP